MSSAMLNIQKDATIMRGDLRWPWRMSLEKASSLAYRAYRTRAGNIKRWMIHLTIRLTQALNSTSADTTSSISLAIKSLSKLLMSPSA